MPTNGIPWARVRSICHLWGWVLMGEQDALLLILLALGGLALALGIRAGRM